MIEVVFQLIDVDTHITKMHKRHGLKCPKNLENKCGVHQDIPCLQNRFHEKIISFVTCVKKTR
jgi:hypothetical protein